MALVRFDIISDTHGYLSSELLNALQGANYIVHAGDITSREDYETLQKIAPVKACLGNNDFCYNYGPQVKKKLIFFSSGFKWEVCHYRERLDLTKCAIAICGHTHRPFVERDERTKTLVMNPGSPTYPRGREGATMGRIFIDDETVQVMNAQIISVSTLEVLASCK